MNISKDSIDSMTVGQKKAALETLKRSKLAQKSPEVQEMMVKLNSALYPPPPKTK